MKPSGDKNVSLQADFPNRHPDSSFRPIGDDGGLVVLPGKAEVKVLNPAAIKIFGLLDGTRTLDQIADEIIEEFEVPRETALLDLKTFLEELSTHGMLT